MSAAQLAAFAPELAILEAHPRVRLRVHVTKVSKEQSLSRSLLSPQLEIEVELVPRVANNDVLHLPTLDEKLATAIPTVTIDKIPITTDSETTPLPPYTIPGRPHVLSIVQSVAAECSPEDRVLVAACGPTGLSNDVRDAVRDCTRSDGPSLTLHLEAFGW